MNAASLTKGTVVAVAFLALTGLAGGIEAEAATLPTVGSHGLHHEVASQDWYRLTVPFRQAACDIRGANGGTAKGYRKATKYVIRQTRLMGPGRTHNRNYREAMVKMLEAC